ncbi:hypothetical protein V1460_26350 [Streptomyces sp. SCSIO 30461]|uniref:hypothetical protein n=1 Tax=Streptomyces sp. SCSIO 30461 TaxID=3118085 RepID=UPI0030CBF986
MPPQAPAQQPAPVFPNPYAQPVPQQLPQQQPQPTGFGYAPFPGPPQTHPAPPFAAAPGGPRPGRSGSPVAAVVLAFFVSVLVSLLYGGAMVLTYEDQSLTIANALYLTHASVNAAIVGLLAGLLGHRRSGAHVGAAVVAALGAFFGYCNAVLLIAVERQSPSFVVDVLGEEPFFPAKAWWYGATGGEIDWFSPLGLVLAAVIGWGVARLIGSRRRQG